MLKTRLENEGYEVWCSSDLVHPAVNGSGCCEGSGEDGHGDDSTSGRQVLSQEGRLRSIPTLPSVCSDCATGAPTNPSHSRHRLVLYFVPSCPLFVIACFCSSYVVIAYV